MSLVWARLGNLRGECASKHWTKTNDALLRYYRGSEALMNLSSTARQIVFWLLIIAGALLLYKLVNPRGSSYQNVDLVRLYQMMASGTIKELTVKQAES